MKEGKIFDAHDLLYQVNVGRKNIIKTGPDHVLSVHYLKNVRSIPVSKSILSIAEYKKRWIN